MGFFKIILTVLQLLSAGSLVALVMLQTTKSEGLTGTIGGKMSSSFRGKPGVDEKLGLFTRYAAISFMVLTALVYYLHVKFNL
ncbi:MAG: preprotein translocase subunit SecG [Armatimonadetes bacterium]|nr:preprotein translocase subunit SecG [Armatimonadota bacterium]